MSNAFDDAAESSADSFLESFGEDVTYKKRSGATRAVRGIKTILSPQQLGDTEFSTARATIDVKPSATGTIYNGIAPTECQPGDKISMVRMPGGAAEDFTILGPSPDESDAGLVRYVLS
jgi:hypothetical protein